MRFFIFFGLTAILSSAASSAAETPTQNLFAGKGRAPSSVIVECATSVSINVKGKETYISISSPGNGRSFNAGNTTLISMAIEAMKNNDLELCLIDPEVEGQQKNGVIAILRRKVAK